MDRGETVSARYFTWRLRQRKGVYFADGRTCTPNLGRNSLGTRDRTEALTALTELDLVKAVEHGLADPGVLSISESTHLTLEKGRKLYIDHAGRSRVAGGVRASSLKRYRAVFDKFLEFVNSRGLNFWNQITAETLLTYSRHLEDKDYAYRTIYLELTTLKQVVGWLVDKQHLPPDRLIKLPLSKPNGTDTYCWSQKEVQAILDFCAADQSLGWLRSILLTLSATGLRISELGNLRWSDIDLEANTIRLKDETASRHKNGKGEVRTTKGGRGRSFPIHDELLPVLVNLPRHRDGYVFHGPAGGRVKADTIRNIFIRDVLEPLSKRFPTPDDEVGFINGRLHSFRHFFCSLCANRGVPQAVVMRWLGHRDSLMVQHYYHLHDEEGRRQMGRLRLTEDASGNGADGKESSET
jgi:integrase